MLEFVVFNAEHKEVDWIDPVENCEESESYWIVDNGYFEYAIKKQPGFDYVVRPLHAH